MLIAICIYAGIAVPFAIGGWMLAGIGSFNQTTPATRFWGALAYGAGWPFVVGYVAYSAWRYRGK